MTQNADSTLRWQIQILTLIWEQFAVPLDLLAALLSMEEPAAEAIVDDFVARKWVKVAQFFENDERWVWLRSAGAEQCGGKVTARKPGLNLLQHVRAVCEVRVRLEDEYPEGEWICERRILGSRRKTGHQIPDAIFRIPDGAGGVRQWAVEVELSAKTKREYRDIVRQRCARYDRVIYFCPPYVATRLRDIAELSHPKVQIDVSLKSGWETENFRWKPLHRSDPPIVPERIEPWQAELLRVLAEQSGIPMDQFGRFLERDAVRAEQIAEGLEEDGLIWRALGPAKEGPWVFPTRAGAAMARLDIRPKVPRMLWTRRLREVNEARLVIRERAPDAVWRNANSEGTHGGNGGPVGFVMAKGREYAVEVEPKAWKQSRLRRKYGRRYADHRRKGRYLMVVCPPKAVESLRDVSARCGWKHTWIEGSEALTSAPSAQSDD